MLVIIGSCLTVIIKTHPVSQSSSIVAIILAILILIFVLLIGYLFVFHLFLIVTNQTTNEYNKSKRLDSLNKKNFLKNFVYIWCSSLQPSFKRYAKTKNRNDQQQYIYNIYNNMMMNNDSRNQNNSIYSNISSRDDTISVDRNSDRSNNINKDPSNETYNTIRPNYQTLNKAVGLVTNSIVVSSY
jgi:hypothetical protein